MKKNNLDEMQEQALLKIEHNGCWLAFWGLLAALIVQGALGFEIKAMAGEWIVFMLLSLYIAGDCLRRGIWDRTLKPDRKTNLIVSLLAGIVVWAFVAIRSCITYPGYPVSSILGGLLAGAISFAICFLALNLCASIYKKRKDQLEQE